MDIKEFDSLFKSPFAKDGTPQEYLRLLLPLFEKDKVSRKEMLLSANINLDNSPHLRTSFSTVLNKLAKHEVLVTQANSPKATWSKGKNWDFFMLWLTKNMLANNKLRPKFKNILFKEASNSLQYIFED